MKLTSTLCMKCRWWQARTSSAVSRMLSRI
jgi:hypothetical protein